MVNVTHEPVKKAMGSIRQLSADEEAQRLAEARARGLWNWNHSINAARRQGLDAWSDEILVAGSLSELFGSPD